METFIEISGIIASLLVFVSFLPSDIKIIRWLNLVGSIFFVFYGVNIGAIWTAVTNGGLFFVQAYHLIRIYRKEHKNAKI